MKSCSNMSSGFYVEGLGTLPNSIKKIKARKTVWDSFFDKYHEKIRSKSGSRCKSLEISSGKMREDSYPDCNGSEYDELYASTEANFQILNKVISDLSQAEEDSDAEDERDPFQITKADDESDQLSDESICSEDTSENSSDDSILSTYGDNSFKEAPEDEVLDTNVTDTDDNNSSHEDDMSGLKSDDFSSESDESSRRTSVDCSDSASATWSSNTNPGNSSLLSNSESTGLTLSGSSDFRRLTPSKVSNIGRNYHRFTLLNVKSPSGF